MATKRASTAKGKSPRPSRARRRETAAEKRERLAREERNRRARERRAQRKREEEERAREAERKREARNRKARERRAVEREVARRVAEENARVRAEAVAKLIEENARKLEAIKADEKNRKRRERRERQRQNRPPPRPQEPQREEHPPGTDQDRVVAEGVLELWKSELKDISRQIGGRFRTHLFSETSEVTGQVWRDAPEDLGDMGVLIGGLGDAYRSAEHGLYYAETFFQGFATVLVAGKKGKKGGSPLNESRVGPDGKHYRSARTYWFYGDVQKCLVALGQMVARVLNGRAEFTFVKFGVRQYWSPLRIRPER